MFRRILVAIDNSAMGRAVFEEALSIAKATRARLMLLHVLSDTEVGQPDVKDLNQHLTQWEDYNRQGLSLLQLQQAIAQQAQVETEYIQTPGAAPSTICSLAKSWGADLIVVGQRELSTLQRLIRGSVSNYVLHYAPCSVLTVHPQTAASPTH